MVGCHAFGALQRVLHLRCDDEVAQVPLHRLSVVGGFNCQRDAVSAVADDDRAVLLLRVERLQAARASNPTIQQLLRADASARVYDQVTVVEPVRLTELVRIAPPHIDLQLVI